MALGKASISWTIKQIFKMNKNKRFNFKNIYQRSLVWERTRKSEFIHSLVEGYPVPPLYARVLWRSFLSFQSVSPVGMRALVREVASRYPFLAPAEGEDRLTATRQELAEHGLLRSEPTFIGARGLA